jgi:hypothetical protein
VLFYGLFCVDRVVLCIFCVDRVGLCIVFCRSCCSMYCLCVNVYCTAATGCQPNCSLTNISYHIIYYSASSANVKLLLWVETVSVREAVLVACFMVMLRRLYGIAVGNCLQQ